MGLIAINGVSEETDNLLQSVAARMAYEECRRVSKSSLAKQIIETWLEQNATDKDREMASK